jgi:DNA-binding HxlR family transcriptional regulator
MKPNHSCYIKENGLNSHDSTDKHTPGSCQVQKMFKLFGKKYTLPIIHFLLDKKVLRFSEIEKLVCVNPRTLTIRLREMVIHGLITRKMFYEIPLRVDYQLTPAGEGLRELMTQMINWAEKCF